MMKLNKLAPPVKRWFDEGFKLISVSFGFRPEMVPVRVVKQNSMRNKK